MASASDIKFMHASLNPDEHDQKVGGSCSSSSVLKAVADLEDDERQLFKFMVFNSQEVSQHRKIFIKNLTGETLTNFEIYFYNTDPTDKMMGMSPEVGQDQSFKLGGDEVVKNYMTEPGVYAHPNFTEYVDVNGYRLSIGSLTTGQAVGLWVRATCGFIVAPVTGKTARLGYRCKDGGGASLSGFIDIMCDRYLAYEEIYKWVESSTATGSIEIFFNRTDTAPSKAPVNSTVHAVYVDGIPHCEAIGSDRATVFIRGGSIPVNVSVYLLPSSGYPISTVNDGMNTRIFGSFDAAIPEYEDVVSHHVLQKGHAEEDWSMIGVVLADQDSGSGFLLDKFEKDV